MMRGMKRKVKRKTDGNDIESMDEPMDGWMDKITTQSTNR